MNTVKPKEINVIVSKIINWPEPESKESKFELSFYSKLESALIISKVIDGKYIREERTMLLNSMLKISYPINEDMVILRLSHKMGFGGLMVLGEFNISLISLSQKKELKYCIDSTKSQYIIIEHHNDNLSKNGRTNKLISQEEILGELIKYEENYGLEQKRSSKTKEFIKERQEFLERYSNSSRKSSGLSARDRLIGSGVTLRRNVSNYNQKYYSEEDHDFMINNQDQHCFSNARYHQPYEFNNNNNCYTSQYSIRVSEQKLINKNLHNYKNSHKRDNSLTNSEKTNSSSQRYLLLVSNLNVVPCDEYYETRTKNVVKQNVNKIESVNELQLNTNQKKIKNIYTQNNLSELDNETEEKEKQKMAYQLKQQFKRHSEYI